MGSDSRRFRARPLERLFDVQLQIRRDFVWHFTGSEPFRRDVVKGGCRREALRGVPI
jgi:hypothetical protein